MKQAQWQVCQAVVLEQQGGGELSALQCASQEVDHLVIREGGLGFRV